MPHTFTSDDEGKKVIGTDGEQIGIVSSVESGRAYVDPDPGISDTVMSKLGWGDVDDGDFPLEESNVDTVTDDEIRLGL